MTKDEITFRGREVEVAEIETLLRLGVDSVPSRLSLVQKLYALLDIRAQFHQHSTYSFYAPRSQKRKKTLTI